MLILGFISFFRPEAEGVQGFFIEQMDEGYGTAVDGLVELFIDEAIGEVDVGGVLLGVAVINASEMCPVDGAEAHGARLAGGVDDAVGQVEGAEFSAGLTDGVHLGVGRRVVIDGDTIGASCDDLAILDDDGTEGASSVLHALIGQADCLAHKLFIFFRNSRHDTKMQANIVFFFQEICRNEKFVFLYYEKHKNYFDYRCQQWHRL